MFNSCETMFGTRRMIIRVHFFPIGFLVLVNIEEDADIPLILGRPFMLTAKCVVDMGNGNM